MPGAMCWEVSLIEGLSYKVLTGRISADSQLSPCIMAGRALVLKGQPCAKLQSKREVRERDTWLVPSRAGRMSEQRLGEWSGHSSVLQRFDLVRMGSFC